MVEKAFNNTQIYEVLTLGNLGIGKYIIKKGN
jgi:hypothetical protein